MRSPVLGHGQDHEVGDENAIRVEVAHHELRRLVSTCDQNALPRRNRGDRRAAPVEDHELGVAVERLLDARGDIARPRNPGEPATGAPAADRRDTRERRCLEVVGRCVRALAHELKEILDGRPQIGNLRLRGASASHRDDDEVMLVREQPRRVPRDGRLAEPLAGADHGERRKVERLVLRNAEREVGALVGDTEREQPAREPETLARSQHRLVRDVHRHFGLEARERLLEVGGERDAVLVPAHELLRASDEQRADEVVRDLCQRVADNRCVVLPIDERQRSHRVVTSPSIRAVYFSNARVSSENWMIRSCP